MNNTKQRFFIIGMALSEPGTMGGNSKIALEMARCLCNHYEIHFILPKRKRPTLDNAIGLPEGLLVHEVPGYTKIDFNHPIASTLHYYKELKKVFNELQPNANDVVYMCSEFHVDSLPSLLLKRRFGYKWIPAQFLFPPFIIENLVKGYKFPPIKYLFAWLYSRILFTISRWFAWAYVITNDSDLKFFPKSFHSRVFSYYGGVNVEQIPLNPEPQKFDVVFCSRLHPQKGIDGFLDIWQNVVKVIPTVTIGIIGNGDASYEAYLKAKAQRLGIAETITWLGYVNNEAKYRIYRSARLHVHPTIFDNNGMVAAEALCSGLPVVMYDLPALKHVYNTGCFKVPYGDKKAFAAGIVRMLTDTEFANQIKPNAEQIQELRHKWDWHTRAERFSTWLDQMIQNDKR